MVISVHHLPPPKEALQVDLEIMRDPRVQAASQSHCSREDMIRCSSGAGLRGRLGCLAAVLMDEDRYAEAIAESSFGNRIREHYCPYLRQVCQARSGYSNQ